MDTVEGAKGGFLPECTGIISVLNVCEYVIVGTSPTVFGHTGIWCCMRE